MKHRAVLNGCFIIAINPACFINIFLAFFALALYTIGSYRLYKGLPRFVLYFSLAIAIDVLTALLASTRITPTANLDNMVSVPWYSLLFRAHVLLSTVGLLGFIGLFIYLLIKKGRDYQPWIRSWQFKVLLPIWVVGECIALTNALSKVLLKVRIFDLV